MPPVYRLGMSGHNTIYYYQKPQCIHLVKLGDFLTCHKQMSKYSPILSRNALFYNNQYYYISSVLWVFASEQMNHDNLISQVVTNLRDVCDMTQN